MLVSGAENKVIPVRGETPSCAVIITGIISHVLAQGGYSSKNPDSSRVVSLPPGLKFNLSHSDLSLGKTTR